MVSMSGAMSAGSASNYFQKDNYYIKDGETEKGKWNGAGAERLGMSGEVSLDQFKALEHGYDPSKLNEKHIKALDQFSKTSASLNHQLEKAEKAGDQEKISELKDKIEQYNEIRKEFDKSLPDGAKLIRDGKNENGMTMHRAGFDITFSAPKSASIVGLVYGDKRVIDAHKNAMNTAMSYIQENFAQTRERSGGGERNYVSTEELTYAQFNHYTSRSADGAIPDPQLHTHNMIFNITHTRDGRAMSLEPQQIYASQKLADQIYQNEFARGVEKAGYAIEWNKKGDNYNFEIKGISKDMIDHFSKRDAQIESHLKAKEAELGRPLTTEEKSVLKLETRSAKEAQDLSKLYDNWKEQARDLGYSKEQFQDKSGDLKSDKNSIENAKSAVNTGVSNLDSQKSVFTNHDIILESLKASRGVASLSNIKEAIKESSAVDLDTKSSRNNKTELYSSKEILKAENRILVAVEKGKGSVEPVVSKEKIEELTSKRESFQSMTTGQQESAKMVLTTNDRFTIVQGAAGSGKTTMLAELKGFLDKEASGKIELVGLAPTGKAASEIEEKGIKAQTIDSFLLQKEAKAEYTQKVYIVDESSMLETKKLEALVDRAEQQNARVVFIGDTEQLKAVGAGDMFSKMQERGVKTVKMEESVRQNRAANGVKSIVENFRNVENVRSGMKKLDESGRLIEAEKSVDALGNEKRDIEALKNQLVENAVKDYTEKGLNKTIVLTSTNAEKAEISSQIRFQLQENGTISKENHAITVLEQKSLNKTDAKLAMSYEKGDIMISKGMQGDIKNGMKTEVLAIDKENNRIQLSYENGKGEMVEKWIDAEKAERFNTYVKKEKDFANGDKITFTKNDKDLGLKNGETAIVKEIDENGVMTVEKDGRNMKVDTQEYQHVDTAYAMTTYKSQGQSVENVHVFAMSDQGLNTHNAGYVQVSRTKDEVTLYTDNKEALEEKYSNEQIKENATDYLSFSVEKSEISQSEKTEIDSKNDFIESRTSIDDRIDELYAKYSGDLISSLESEQKESETSKIEEKIESEKEAFNEKVDEKTK